MTATWNDEAAERRQLAGRSAACQAARLTIICTLHDGAGKLPADRPAGCRRSQRTAQ